MALSVEDRGPGIDPRDLPHIFEPFYRWSTPDAPDRAGVGLGLSVAQRIASTFRGSLAVRSVLGQGSRFVLLLPEVVGGGDGDGDVSPEVAEPMALS